MEETMALLTGVLFGVGVYLIQQRSLLQLVLGLLMLGGGANLAVVTLAGLRPGAAAPVIVPGIEAYTDPLPQALILTAVVIGFGVLSFTLVLAYRVYQKYETDDMHELRLDEPDKGGVKEGHHD